MEILGPKWLFLHVAINALPFTHWSDLIVTLLNLLIPAAGRMGAGINSEIVIAFTVSLLTIFLSSFVVPLILLTHKVGKIFRLFVTIFCVFIAILVFTPLGFPYSGELTSLAPQRFMIVHTKRIFHYATGAVVTKTGYWTLTLDMNSPHSVKKYVPEVARVQPVDQDCIHYLYCGMPYFAPGLSILWKTHWIPGPEPEPLPKSTFKILKKETTGDKIKFLVEIDAPTTTNIIISPVLGVELTRWTLGSGKPLQGPLWNGRNTHFIFYGYGLKPTPFKFTMDFQVPSGHSGPIMDLALCSQFMSQPRKSSKRFRDFIAQFPSWTTVASWTAIYESWTI